MSQRLLIVDDDKDICEILTFNLKHEGFDVDYAYSAEEALSKPLKEFQLILLDVMMGGMNGYKFAEHLRTRHLQTPIIFLTAKDTENDILTGFSVGGDDFISKPFSIKEVVARVKALLRRSLMTEQTALAAHTIEIGDLSIDPEAKKVMLEGCEVLLTKTEFELLKLLAEHPNRVFSRDEIIDKVWSKTPYITERTVDVHLTRLRKKMGKYASAVSNRSGYGYRFDTSNL